MNNNTQTPVPDHSMSTLIPITASPSEHPATAAHAATSIPPTGGVDARGKEYQSPLAGGITGSAFAWCLIFLEKRGKEKFGPKFRICPEDHKLIFKLLVYFLGLRHEAQALNLDLTKGILLTGPIGCGKTRLMALMKLVAFPGRNFTLKPCREVSLEFINEGYEVIHRYSQMSYTAAHPRIYCFDDLGAEQTIKYYGNECNVMGEILLSRYDHYFSSDMITHVTTNLSSTKLENLYGNRVRSRMREMFNLIPFHEPAQDKRT